MSHEQNTRKPFENSVIEWIDVRLPLPTLLRDRLADHPTPKNLTFTWNLGSLAALALMMQLFTGIFLAMHYVPEATMAFDSVEKIMREVNYGWLLRYMHAVGASMFFVIVYGHIAKAMYFGSYKPPRELLWWMGVVIFVIMIATAFMGYVLPWGQMSFWAATVITSLFTVIPFVGDSIAHWLWGGYSVGSPTLNRFFALHYLLPFILIAVAMLHVVALNVAGSSNPSGVKVKTKKDTIPFHPFYTIKDFFGFGVFFIIFAGFVFFAPNYLGHPDNYIPANPLVTPEHIVPEWYFLPLYAMLRAIPNKTAGALVLVASLLVLFAMPYLDTHKTTSGHYRPWFKKFFWLFAANYIFLGWLGKCPPEGWYIWAGRLGVVVYFSYFLIVMPLLSKYEPSLPQPESVDADYSAKRHKSLHFIFRFLKNIL